MITARAPAVDVGESETFLRNLFGDTPGFVAINHAVPTPPGAKAPPLYTDWFPTSDYRAAAERAAELCRRRHVWIGAGLMAEPLPPGTRGGSDHVIAIPGIWADVDISHPVHKKADRLPPDLDAALSLIRTAFRAAPTFVNDTGHGLQPWWLFPEPLIIRDAEARATAVNLLNRLKAQLAAAAAAHGWTVDAVMDLARLMRLPGTVNIKAEPVPVRVLEDSGFLRYTPADLDDALDPLPAPEPKKPARPPTPRQPNATDAALLDRARNSKHGAEFSRLWNGDDGQHGGDTSAADMALANLLAFWTGGDRGWMDSLWRQSGRMRPKWDAKHYSDGRTYGAGTIDAALAGRTDYYNWSGNGNGHHAGTAGKAAGAEYRRDQDKLPSAVPRPIPLDVVYAPEMPAGIFTGWMGAMVDAVSASMETPPELAATFALAAVAAVAQNRFSVRVKSDYFEPLNIWPLCAMDPGNRKTAVMINFIEPLCEWERAKAAEMGPVIEAAKSQRKSAEARISWLREQAKKVQGNDDFKAKAAEIADMEGSLPEIPAVPILFSQDVTPEHTGTLMAENDGRLALISDEAGVFDQMAGRYNGGVANLDLYLQGHAGGMVKVHRGSRPPVVLSHPALTIAVSPQPEVLKGLSTRPGFRGRGLLARFAYMIPRSRLGDRTGDGPPVEPGIRNAYRNAILALASVAPDHSGGRPVPHVLYLSDDALALWREFWREVEGMMGPGGELCHLADWGGKLPGLVARVAGLLHLADFASEPLSSKSIADDVMARAITFGKYLIPHAKTAFGAMGADVDLDAARHLWDAIEKRRQPELTARDAWQLVRGRYPKMTDVDGAFDVLIDRAYLIEPHQADDMPRKRGRPPSRQLLVNPHIVKRWDGG